MDIINEKIKLYRKTRALYYEVKKSIDTAELNSLHYFYKYKEYFLKDDYLANKWKTKYVEARNFVDLSQEGFKNLKTNCINLKKELKQHFRNWK